MNIDIIERKITAHWWNWGNIAGELLEENPISYEAIVNAEYSKPEPIQGEIYVGYRKHVAVDAPHYKIFYFPHDTPYNAVFVNIDYNKTLAQWEIKKHVTQSTETPLRHILRFYRGWILWSDILKSKSLNFINWINENPLEEKQ